MATYPLNPMRFTGVERHILAALVKITEGNVYPLELRIPFPTKAAASSAKSRLWAYCRAIESLRDAKQVAALAISPVEASALLRDARIARNFTGRVLPALAPDEGAILHLIAQSAVPEVAPAMDYLTEILTQPADEGTFPPEAGDA